MIISKMENIHLHNAGNNHPQAALQLICQIGETNVPDFRTILRNTLSTSADWFTHQLLDLQRWFDDLGEQIGYQSGLNLGNKWVNYFNVRDQARDKIQWLMQQGHQDQARILAFILSSLSQMYDKEAYHNLQSSNSPAITKIVFNTAHYFFVERLNYIQGFWECMQWMQIQDAEESTKSASASAKKSVAVSSSAKRQQNKTQRK